MLMAVSIACSSPAIAQIQNFQRENSQESPKKAERLDHLYRASQFYFLGATVLDLSSTAQVLGHPSVARGENEQLLARYYGTETGWASFLGERNAGAAVAANASLNAGLGLLSQRLYRRGGRWRILAIGINVLKGTDNLAAGIHNLNYIASIDGRVRALTHYRGRIYWSR